MYPVKPPSDLECIKNVAPDSLTLMRLQTQTAYTLDLILVLVQCARTSLLKRIGDSCVQI